MGDGEGEMDVVGEDEAEEVEESVEVCYVLLYSIPELGNKILQ